MRKLILLALTGFLVLNAHGARRLSVAQLEETLTVAVAEHRADADIVRQIAGIELSERLTAATLDRLAARISLQPRTALALQLLSDQSAFLDPPSSEFLATAAPDAESQQQMLESARANSVETWARLPNFFVARDTTRFDDGAEVLKQGDWPVRAGLHSVGTSTRQITFRDGKEVVDPTAEASSKSASELGLHSWGEFGPALTVVLTDMAKTKASFSHWEQVSGVLAAVYHYQVPREASHYAVTYSFSREQILGRTQYGVPGRDRSPQQVANIPRASEIQAYSETPSYHGSIALDPTTGAVLRLTIEAELSKGDPLQRAATAIEYAPVVIGDRKYICPSRSLAISLQPPGRGACGLNSTTPGVGSNSLGWQGSVSGCGNSPVLLINETTFTNYHRLGSTARIVADGSSPAPEDFKPSELKEATAPVANPLPPVTQEMQSSRGGGDQGQAPPAPVADSSPTTSTSATVATPPAPATPIIPEVSMSDVDEVPDFPSGPAQTDTGFSLKVTTRLVDIGLVATDKKGHPVTDLKPEDFEVYDGSRKQEIRFFTAPTAPAQIAVASAQVAVTPPAPAEQPHQDFSNRAPEPTPSAPPSAPRETGGTILLVDESHIAWGDMQNARNHMLKFLETVPPSERVGLYTMNGLAFHVLIEVTSDHAALTARLKKFMPTAQSLQKAQEEETRNRQQYDYVHNVADLNSVNGNHNDVADAEQPIDPQLLTMGNNPARASLIILAQVARHLASIPGHKNLVWVSSDNVLADWQDQQVGIDKSPKSIESFALRAQEAMNEAHAAVYPFDVSQLEAGGIGADLQHANVQLAPAQADNMATAASAGGGGGAGTSVRDTGNGRITATMSQDLHPIQGQVRDLASATGGRTIRRSGDLASELNGIVDDGRATYQLSISPEGPADDQYHKLTIKLTGRKGVTLRYRTGYLYAKEPVTLKDRFRQAIWRPTDVTEIGVTAQVNASGAESAVKLNITAGDLGMEQRGSRWMDKLDIFFIQRDDAGIHAQVEGQTLGLRLKTATYQNVLSLGVPFERAIELHSGMASLRVLVVDENSGRIGSITIPAAVLHSAPLQAKSF